MAEEHTGNSPWRLVRRVKKPLAALCVILLPIACLKADLIEMRNGDRYVGKVLSLTNDTLILQSEVLGKVNVPRSKIVSITLGTNLAARPAAAATGTNSAPTAPTGNIATGGAIITTAPAPAINVLGGPSFHTFTNALPDLSALNKPDASSSSIIRDVREQLTAAGPAAIGKFDQMLSELMSGKMTVNDLKAQARTAADQLRQYKRELGSDADDSLDGYLAILDSFLQDNTSAAPIPKVDVKSAKPATEPASGGK